MKKNIIRLTESTLKRLIKESVKCVLKEDNDIAIFEIYDAFENYGFGSCESDDVRYNGRDGIRFLLDKNRKDADFDGLVSELISMVGKGNVIKGTATHRYAPEIKNPTVTILY